MATRQENYDSALDNYARLLAEISANRKPSYSIDGQSVSWTEYQRFLVDQIKALQELEQTSAGPFEVRTYGNTR